MCWRERIRSIANTLNMKVTGKSVALAFCALLLGFTFSAAAQQLNKIPRIGYLAVSSKEAHSPREAALRQGLRELGYIEGKNIVIEYRYAEGKSDRLRDLAAELVHLNVDTIVT